MPDLDPFTVAFFLPGLGFAVMMLLLTFFPHKTQQP